jgi:hypothetical protein
MLLLPLSVGRLAGGGREPGGVQVLRGCCGVALGLFGWAVALPTGQGLVNGLLYPLVDAHDYQHSWGGPTLIGAWAVHALVAVPVVAFAIGVLWGTAAVDHVLDPAPGERRPRWPVLLSSALALLAALLLNAWLHQV